MDVISEEEFKRLIPGDTVLIIENNEEKEAVIRGIGTYCARIHKFSSKEFENEVYFKSEIKCKILN